MRTISTNLDPEAIAKLQGLELRSRRIVDGYLSGMHRSVYRGQSVEFTEHREYAPGDDLRYVDWKVFGKSDKVYLKQFEAETDLVCYLLLDVSESMRYRADASPMSKLEYAQCLAAAVGSIVLKQRDSVGLTTCDDQLRDVVRASSNPTHVRQLVQVMEQAEVTRRSALGAVLDELSQRLPRRGIVLVISDLLGDVESMLAGLKHLRYQRHDVLVLQTLDRAELEFPFARTTLFRGLESMPEVMAESRGIRQAYLRELHQFLHRIKVGCQSLRVDYDLLPTDEPFDDALRRVLTHRRVR
ncbi:MAG: DUF58 domain-containing protein [Planctomycetota bacterium]